MVIYLASKHKEEQTALGMAEIIYRNHMFRSEIGKHSGTLFPSFSSLKAATPAPLSCRDVILGIQQLMFMLFLHHARDEIDLSES